MRTGWAHMVQFVLTDMKENDRRRNNEVRYSAFICKSALKFIFTTNLKS